MQDDKANTETTHHCEICGLVWDTSGGDSCPYCAEHPPLASRWVTVPADEQNPTDAMPSLFWSPRAGEGRDMPARVAQPLTTPDLATRSRRDLLEQAYDEGWRLGQIHAGVECWNFFPEDAQLQNEFAKGWAEGQAWYEEKQEGW